LENFILNLSFKIQNELKGISLGDTIESSMLQLSDATDNISEPSEINDQDIIAYYQRYSSLGFRYINSLLELLSLVVQKLQYKAILLLDSFERLSPESWDMLTPLLNLHLGTCTKILICGDSHAAQERVDRSDSRGKIGSAWIKLAASSVQKHTECQGQLFIRSRSPS
jgi:hypothetical protein